MIQEISEKNPIVIVDDEEVDIYLFKKSLDRSSIKNPFIAFSNGESFINYMAEVKQNLQSLPAVVFLDINMPKMSGFEVLEKIRGDKELNAMPIIVMLSSSAQERDRVKAMALGCNGYQVKPSSTKEYIEFLESFASSSFCS